MTKVTFQCNKNGMKWGTEKLWLYYKSKGHLQTSSIIVLIMCGSSLHVFHHSTNFYTKFFGFFGFFFILNFWNLAGSILIGNCDKLSSPKLSRKFRPLTFMSTACLRRHMFMMFYVKISKKSFYSFFLTSFCHS